MYYAFSPSPPSTSYSTTAAMEIPASSSSTRPNSSSSSCAYPAWPRRTSLSSNYSNAPADHATSYISDDDLFPMVFDDNESSASPVASPSHSLSDQILGVQPLQSDAWMRELMAEEKARKYREREQKQQRRSRSSSSRKSRSSSKQQMSPIVE